MQEEDALEEVECRDDEEIVLPIYTIYRSALLQRLIVYPKGDVLLPFPSNRSRQAISLMATSRITRSASRYPQYINSKHTPFHSNPSCNLKNSLNAGSSFKDANSLGVRSLLLGFATDLRFSAAGIFDDFDKHICASNPSNCRKPFLILPESKEER